MSVLTEDLIIPGTQRLCPDGGSCHHDCAALACFRVHWCGPLSGIFPGGTWPEHVVARYANGGTL